MISAIVVNYEREDLLAACLDSLEIALAHAPAAHEIIVVDNGSRDGSVAQVRSRGTRVHLIQLEHNAGFAGGMVAGLAAARGEWVLTLNNDATIDPHAATALLDAGLSDPSVGAVAAQMRFAHAPGILNSAGIGVDKLGVAYDLHVGEPVEQAPSERVEVFGASAGGALYRRAMLDAIGGFEPSFFAFLEDVDVAWRARAAGWSALHEPAAIIWHHHSATAGHGSPFKHRLVGRNRVRLLARNADAALLRRWGWAMLLYDVAYVVLVAARERSLVPLQGRVQGLRYWRRDRPPGSARVAVTLDRPRGLRAALSRHAAWARAGSPTPAAAATVPAPPVP